MMDGLRVLLPTVAGLWLGVACSPDPKSVDACTQGAIDLYEQRIEPVLSDDQPASCNQCHLSGVDLSLFVRDTPCETMACLVQQELVDLKAPEQSRILDWIERASPDSRLITDEVIRKEYDAFYEWIAYVADCGACAGAKCSSASGIGFCDLDVEPSEAYDPERDPGGCDSKVLERVFMETVYVTRGRCYPCHFTSANNPPAGATLWLVEADSCEASSLSTMRNVIREGYVNVEDPLQSLFLLKPLAESDGGVVHGGHDKFTKDDDPAYTNFVYWLERYAACARGD